MTPLPRPTKEGRIPFKIPSVDKPCYTHYQIFGDISKKIPIVGLHGGPAGKIAHQFSIILLWQQFGIPAILYDQIGCGGSTLLPEKYDDRSFWQVPLFVDELDNLVNFLDLRGTGFCLFGESWGAGVAAEYATSRPRGLRKLLLACPYASTALFQTVMDIRVSELPRPDRDAIAHAHATRDYENQAYKDGLLAFFQHAVIRTKPWKPEWVDHIFNSGWLEDPVRAIIPIEGSVSDWNVTSRLHKINVPTLMWDGEFDTAYDLASRPFFEHIPKVRWAVFPGVGQAVMTDETPQHCRLIRIIKTFLLNGDLREQEALLEGNKLHNTGRKLSSLAPDTKTGRHACDEEAVLNGDDAVLRQSTWPRSILQRTPLAVVIGLMIFWSYPARAVSSMVFAETNASHGHL
ncbi:hypothetical protein ANO11243_091190 [Dothideomycetidae sp. 11243]|nr:hypothetical protein ANO11243_091190 [fungal sp. No.11243]